MGIIDYIKYIFKKSIEKIAINVTTYFILFFIAVIIIIFRDVFIELMNYESKIKLWQIIFIVLFSLFLSKMYEHHKSKSKIEFLKYGMEWRSNIEKNQMKSLEGPFCPRCKFKMISTPFQCSMCNTKYTAISSTNITEARQTVQNIIEAELRGGKILIMDWHTSTSFYPNSSFRLKNIGVSTAENISIQIKLGIETERRDIGTYKFDKIEPDKEIRIEKSDPMRNIHNILKEFNFLYIESIDLTHEEEDEYGRVHEIPDYIEWTMIRREFSCNLDVNVNYSLKNKIKNQQNKYLMEFKFVEPAHPWGYEEGEYNCEIFMHQIE